MMDISSIQDNKDLATFIRMTIKEIEDNKEAIENPTFEQFWEAMQAWAEDSDGCYRNFKENLPPPVAWQTCAKLIQAALYYE